MMSTPSVKRLFWDIETSPNIVLAFRAGYNLTINHDAILTERKVICIGYKWEGEKHPTVLRWTKGRDDGPMLKRFCDVSADADELVHHFGDKFDLPWLRTRCLVHKLPPLPLHKTVDTKMLSSKYFYFNSNKLDYISNLLGHGRKLHTDFDLWKRVMAGDQDALDYMCKYCGVDVNRLESVFNDLQLHVKPETHVGVLNGAPRWSCPRDGSLNVKKSKTRATSSGQTKHQMICNDCQGYFQIPDSIYKVYQKRDDLQEVRCSTSKRNCKRCN